MAWQWSHSQKAYDNAKSNLYKQSLQWLKICLAEIEAELPANSGNFDERTYKTYMEAFKQCDNVDLYAESIWEVMSTDIRMCDNGGFNAWACPFGCHTVPFDKLGDENE